jgi:serine/threonine-protein kinase HipA
MKLDVFLFNEKCGELFSTPDRGITFKYADDYLADGNSLPLSLSLPLTRKLFTQKECIPYFIGLLPEGEIKQRIADELHISESSTIKLLEALGGECAGTVSLFNSEDTYQIPLREYIFSSEYYELIDTAQLAEKIRNCSRTPFIRSERNYRLSLAGAQQKISLAQFDGKWYIPKNGAPSTHIIKPARNDYPDITANEYLCMTIAKYFLNTVPEVGLLKFSTNDESFNVFCIQRFDRLVTSENGTIHIRRIHQEDFCQALGIMSDTKYQNDGGPGIKDILTLLREKSATPVIDVEKAVELFIFQFLIGNCDAHGKNYSLLNDGRIKLAPAYDIVSTTVYPDLSDRMSMSVGGHYEIDKISRNHFIDTFDSCGINSRIVNRIIKSFTEKAEDIEKLLIHDSVAGANPDLAEKIIRRMKSALA